MANKITLGVIIGHRDCFPGHLAEKGRQELIAGLKKRNIDMVIIPEGETKYGAVENLVEARKTADLFRAHQDKIDGILVSLPDFGDERAIADTIRLSGLAVPVLVQAYPDVKDRMSVENRRDSFCGKISTCQVLRQYGIRYSLTSRHTSSLKSKEFEEDINKFTGICRVVRGLKNIRIGAIGARTSPFKTVRFSEKILEKSGISVETVDLSEIILTAKELKDSDTRIKSKLEAITDYCITRGVPQDALLRLAKLGVALEQWLRENQIDACALQCWSVLQDVLGVFPCVLMSLMNESLIPAACEVDVMGAVAMYALQLASGKPAALFDWNNNYGEETDKLVLFHCCNAPRSMLNAVCLSYNRIATSSRGSQENIYGTCSGTLKSGPITFVRFSTDDPSGRIIGCVGEGAITKDRLDTFGGVGVLKIDKLQELLKFLCRNGLEHHVAISYSKVSAVLLEALNYYLGWDVHFHQK